MSFYTGFGSEQQLVAWGVAVRAQNEALSIRTRSSWERAARAWDALSATFHPADRDRKIYVDLAVRAWTAAARTP